MKHLICLIIITFVCVSISAQTSPLSVRRTPATSAAASTQKKDTVKTTAPASKGAFSTTTATPTTTPKATTPSAAATAPKAQAKAEEKKDNNVAGTSVRAAMQYNTQREVPANPIWKREIYRTLNLSQTENAGLSDPLTPTDTHINLFTLIFKLLADRQLTAYEYTLDGNEQFDAAHRADFKDVLDRYSIYYRRRVNAGTKDTVFVIDNSDIPSSEVMSYFIKEVYYYDQRSSSFHTTVEALCPVLHRSGDFDINTVKYPMFWIRVSDLTPYMNRINIPVSEYNNAATVHLDDYFARQMYKGDIYKTTNPSGKSLAQVAGSDSALVAERARIEAQLSDVESKLWNNQALQPSADSATVEAASTSSAKTQSRRATATSSSEAAPKATSTKTATPSAPRASVRRTRN